MNRRELLSKVRNGQVTYGQDGWNVGKNAARTLTSEGLAVVRYHSTGRLAGKPATMTLTAKGTRELVG